MDPRAGEAIVRVLRGYLDAPKKAKVLSPEELAELLPWDEILPANGDAHLLTANFPIEDSAKAEWARKVTANRASMTAEDKRELMRLRGMARNEEEKNIAVELLSFASVVPDSLPKFPAHIGQRVGVQRTVMMTAMMPMMVRVRAAGKCPQCEKSSQHSQCKSETNAYV